MSLEPVEVVGIELEDTMSISTPDSLLSTVDDLSTYSESGVMVEHYVSSSSRELDDVDSAVNVEEGSLCDSIPDCNDFTAMSCTRDSEVLSTDGSIDLPCSINDRPSEELHSSQSFMATNKCIVRMQSPFLGVKSTTALILETRPRGLPPKNEEEEKTHKKLLEALIENAKRKERKVEELNRSRQAMQLKHEEAISQALRIWTHSVLSDWDSLKNTKKVKNLWWSGLPPSIRGRIWKLVIANDLNLTPELYDICLTRAKERMRIIRESDSDSIGSFSAILESAASRESSVDLVRLDVSRTFPHLGIFQKDGPYHDLLQGLLGAYACYRPDVGYVQGMSFIAAVLMLNMEVDEAFICFANLLNRPCQIAFFRLDETLMKAYFQTYEDLLKENLPRLWTHFHRNNLTSSLYIIDWIFTIYAKSLSLDVASRVWDVFFRDGEEFLFRTALGILRLYQEVLLQMDFIQLAEFLTKLPQDLSGDDLFRSIESISVISKKRCFTEILSSYRS